ncbi:MAG TPA: cation:proton antiporter [Verrucomicrobiae bacterium]|nr:cation:proton antiporter [Verrucomicrobiae bacterium]
MASIELVLSLFLLLTFIAALISNRLKAPYTLVLVLTGVLITLVVGLLSLRGSPLQGSMQNVISQIRSIYDLLIKGGGGGLYVGLIVPPLIFEAMIHIRGSDLRSVIKPSLALATIGVLIATVVTGLILWQIVGLSVYVSFLFAALIAPTDVVTVLEVFRRVKVPSKLSALLDTEASFNDATAIIVFTVILSSIGLQKINVFSSLLGFGFTLGAGALIGLGVAFAGEVLSSLIDDRVAETILTIAVVYGSYAFASGVGASGLIAVAVAGLYFGNYTVRTAIEPATREAVQIFWQIAAFIGNSVAFLLIGFEANIVTFPQSIIIIIAAFAAVTVSRAATVYPILAFFRKISGKMTSFWSNVAMLGGVRGALSIALAATITTSTVISETDLHTINTMVFGVAFISIIVQVPLLLRYAKRQIPESDIFKETELDDQFARLSSYLEEMYRLRSEDKISEAEFTERLEESKMELERLIAKSHVTLETRKIIRARATTLFPRLSKISKRKEKNEETKETSSEPK